MSLVLYALRLGVFFLRWLLFIAYGLLQFSAKPGSRLIVPALAMAAAYRYRWPMETGIARALVAVDWQQVPVAALLGLGVVLAVCVGVVLFSHVTKLLIGWRILRFALKLTLLLLVVAIVVVLCGYHLPKFPFVVAYALWHLGWRLPDVVLTLLLLLASCVYAAASRLLTLLLGAFPPMVRPLLPMRRLTAPNRIHPSVPVRVVVPKLPQRMPPRCAEAPAGAD